MAAPRRGHGRLGRAAEVRTRGTTRFADADKWWTETTSRAVVRDDVDEPGTGLVCFGTFAFADEPGDSVLVVPEIVVGRRGGVAWLTTIGRGAIADARRSCVGRAARRRRSTWPSPTAPSTASGGWPWSPTPSPGSTPATWRRSCWRATWSPPPTRPIDVRWPLRRLAETYPMCWTFHVDGLFGATPEMLVRRERGLVTSRVLAGTIRRTGDDERDLALAATLARSSKDLEEHEYAVRSVAEALEPHCSSMNVPEAPFVLHLPNVMHLATDVAGVVHDAGDRVVAPAGRVAAPLRGRRRHAHRRSPPT